MKAGCLQTVIYTVKQQMEMLCNKGIEQKLKNVSDVL